ncbi:MAG: amidotransferase [Chitinivibrionales bacterium]|nr:amidotransferase [Chitinivibrionales bacterium]MBD3397002.1 amidotransferase [Chitinivibrionales bacterium]
MRIHWLQHVPFEGLGSISRWASARSHALTSTRFFEKDQLPDTDEIDLLIIMGGPMSVDSHRRYPWLRRETKFIAKAIASGIPTLGICLGAQLIARALGAKVYPNRHKEIGWWQVEITEEAWNYRLLGFLPSRFTVFQWHSDTFDLPPGSQRIAWSQACRNQAFLYGDTVVGLQFHLECTPSDIRRLVQHCGREIVPGLPYVQTPSEILKTPLDYRAGNAMIGRILSYLASCARSRGSQARPEPLPPWF